MTPTSRCQGPRALAALVRHDLQNLRENTNLLEALQQQITVLDQQVEERTKELRQRNEQLQQTMDQLKEMQDQIVTQQKLASLGALTAGIAHEIKNPLNFVTNFSELSKDLCKELREILQKQRARLEPAQADDIEDLLATLEQNVQKIHEHGKRADSIVRGMLLHSRARPENASRPTSTPLSMNMSGCLSRPARGRTPRSI